ncbi:hypothetical protein [Lacrimispora sp. JR3]
MKNLRKVLCAVLVGDLVMGMNMATVFAKVKACLINLEDKML